MSMTLAAKKYGIDKSSELTWLLIRNQNSFLVKRNGTQFSSEKGNLMNKHCLTYSGLANKDVVDVAPGAKRGVVLTTRSRKNGKFVSHEIPKGSRRVYRSLKKNLSNNFYRADLTKAAVARASALAKTARVNKKPVNKPSPRRK
ncbi:Ribosomal L28e protein family domain-containing protein [Rozella allomycis CSF55]|uniref:Ribosomal L28e protein family domain-containing protein n=1 Tax=Rozella allomycis (strain CSF55) TaxID=988480 RepID=A0A075B096_ROZAC|nr:Ribosomal L28e protein family domain-containing protein [Rozella allomycis CSF55]|eukprot:EPZ35945.1 Ribosomal L28e protein family domain-containing protein [Rozella allomycis CSF55]